MKNIFYSAIFLLAAALSSCNQGNNQNKEANGDKDSFSALAKSDSFKKAHEEPQPMQNSSAEGQMVEYEVAGGKAGHAYLHKSQTESNKYLFIFHEWWGLNDYIKKEADRYAHELGNVNVMAIDMYDGKVTANRDTAAKLTDVDEDRVKAIIQGAYKYAGDKAEVGTVGWCFGGGWSLQTAIMGGSRVKACVMYYGMPEEDKAALKKLQAPVLGLFGTKDDFINPKVVKKFQDNMKTVNKPLEVKSYDAVHAFANPSNPKYDKAAAEDANKMALAFLKKNLMGEK